VSSYEDERIERIEESTVYGIFEKVDDSGIVHNDLIYVGQTTLPLSKRLIFHRAAARNEESGSYDNPLQRYVREEVDEPYKDLWIGELPHETESAAIEDFGDHTLNVRGGDEAYLTGYEGYDWSSEEVDVLEEEGTIVDAAEKLDIPRSQCRNAALKLGLVDRREVDLWSPEEIEVLGTDTDKRVAEELGRTRQSVTKKRQALGIGAPQHQHDRRKLSTEEARDICERSKQGESYASIAEDYPIHRTAVGEIVRGETYTDLDREAIGSES